MWCLKHDSLCLMGELRHHCQQQLGVSRPNFVVIIDNFLIGRYLGTKIMMRSWSYSNVNLEL